MQVKDSSFTVTEEEEDTGIDARVQIDLVVIKECKQKQLSNVSVDQV